MVRAAVRSGLPRRFKEMRDAMSASKVVLQILHICVSVLIFLLLLFGLLRLGTGAYDLGYRVFTEKPLEQEPGTDVMVKVTKGMSAFSLGTMLEEKGLVRDGELFALQMMLSDYAKKVKPGVYTLNTGQTAKEMLKVMAAKETEKEEADKEKKSEKEETDKEKESEKEETDKEKEKEGQKE